MLSESHIPSDRLIPWAAERATSLLAPLGNRWLHVQGVVERASWVGTIFDEADRAFLIAAAYLHDIGYAPSLQQTGFHSLDGASYLRSCQQERLASLVAYHSEAQYEAQLRGLASQLAGFPREYSAVADALTYCDMTTNPVGHAVSFQERRADIFHRYEETHLVAQAIRQALPALTLAVERTQQWLRDHHLLQA
jgi:exopolyphosphatase/pppGpp-phosphohydrolase